MWFTICCGFFTVLKGILLLTVASVIQDGFGRDCLVVPSSAEILSRSTYPIYAVHRILS